MIDRFQGANRPALVACIRQQKFVQNNESFAEELINASQLLEFKKGEPLIAQEDVRATSL